MTDQSKYARAIEAIRMKRHYQAELAEALDDNKWLNMPSCGDLSKVVRETKKRFPDSGYELGDYFERTFAYFTFGVETFEFHQEKRHTDFEPSPAKSLLIVMLMALEGMDKRGEA